MGDDFELVPADGGDEDFVLEPIEPRSLAARVPGGGSALAQQAPLSRSLLADAPAVRETPVQRTARAMSDVELALSGDPEMRQFEVLSTDEGRRGLTKAAKRLPGNIKTTIGSQLTEMGSGAEEYLADSLAETEQRKADEARDAVGKPFSLLDTMTWRSDPELERMAKQHMRSVKSNLAAGDVAAARAQAAREGGAEAVPLDSGPIEQAVQSGASSAAIATPAILLGGPVGGSALMGVGTAAQRRSELLAAGVPEADANQSAAFMGGLEALTEFIPAHALVKRFPGFSQHLAEFMLSELPGENINSVAQLVDDYRLGLRDDVTMDDIIASVRDTSLATAAGGGIQVGIAHTMQGMVDGANKVAEARASRAPGAGPGADSGAADKGTPSPTQSRQVGKTGSGKVEPPLGDMPNVPRESRSGAGSEPTLGTIAATASRKGMSVDDGAQPTEATGKQAVEKVGTTTAAASNSRETNGPEWEELQAVKDGRATPEQVARLEKQGLVIRSETNVPRLLPAGRRRMTELAESNTPKPAEAPAATPPETFTERLKRDEPLRTTIAQMRDEAGWAEEGGRLLRNPDTGEATGRTSWIPNAEWWPNRPAGFNDEEVRGIADRALAGEKLGKRDTRMLEFMRDVHDERQNLDPFLPVAHELPAEHTTDDRYETALVARASSIDEGVVERLAIQHDEDRAGFLTGIKAFLDGHDNQATAPGREASEPAPRQEERAQASRPRLSPEERLARGRAAIAATETFGRDLEAARTATHTQPTFAQVKAGNYAKGTLKFGGMTVALENPKGSTRHGYDTEGKKTWSRTMEADYGYVKGTEGNDGDEVDVFLAGAPDTGKVFVVNQVDPKTGKFDEHKAVLGAHTRAEAEKLYRAHYPKGWKGFGSMTEIDTPGFRRWLDSGRTKRPLDRRGDSLRRQRVAEMAPQELRSALLTHELTDIPNKRAYEEAKKLPTQAAIDVDSLKWVNDNMGHESGNELLKAVASAIHDETQLAYHISGDEFVVQAESPAAARAVMDRVATRLAGARIEVEMPDGTVKTITGLGVSFGLGGTLEQADAALQTHKTEREASGQRAARGQSPPGAAIRSVDKGREDQASRAAEEVAQPRFARRKEAAFNTWFKGSKVVNEDGSPKTVYHGTKADVSEFKENAEGIHFSETPAAGEMRASGEGKNIMPAYLAIKNPKRMRDTGGPWKNAIKEAKRGGYDGIRYLNRYEGIPREAFARAEREGADLDHMSDADFRRLIPEAKESWVAFTPTQIKSAIGNTGAYSPTNPDIRFSRRPTFYSNVIRTTEALTQNKASGEQWWNTISKKPGIKIEELEWMGLKEWLDSAGTMHPIRKADLLEFMQKSQIQVTETLKGAGEENTADGRQQEITRLAEEIRATGARVHFLIDTEDAIEEVVIGGQAYRAYAEKDYDGQPEKGLPDIPDEAIRAKALRILALHEEMQLTDEQREGLRSDGARYEEYTLEGGDNYRELLLTLPPSALPPEPEFEQLTKLPEGYEYITDHRTVGWVTTHRWGVIAPGQVSARPITGQHYSTKEEATEASIEFLNNEQRERLRAEQYAQEDAKTYHSPHFGGVPNILAHVRLMDRTDVDGKKMLFVEEVQSDWHQAGRKQGYATADAANRREELKAHLDRLRPTVNAVFEAEDNLGFDSLSEARRAILQHEDWKERWDIGPKDATTIGQWRTLAVEFAALKPDERVPDAPFKTSWPELAMKRVIRWAAENGYERVGWTTGQQQADRYSLEKHLRTVEVFKEEDGRYSVKGFDESGRTVLSRTNHLSVSAAELPNWIGEELAARAIRDGGGDYSGLDLRVGGEGQREFYDNILPRTVGRYIKKWGGQVQGGQFFANREQEWASGRAVMVDQGVPDQEIDARWRALDQPTRDLLLKMYREKQLTYQVHSFDVTPEMRSAAMEGQPLFARRTTPIEQWELKAFADSMMNKFSLNDFDLRAHKNGDIELELIQMSRMARNEGEGTAVMEHLVQFADARNARIVLNVAGKEKRADWGTTSRARLERFYRRFGFVSNTGRNKQFDITSSMYREPNEAKYSRAGKRAFNEWFGKSKVVDPLGNPLRVFHGTNQALEEFDPARGGMSTQAHSAPHGLFFTASPDIASEYAANAGQRVHADVANFEREIARLQKAAEAATRRGDWKTYETVVAQWEDLEIGSSRDMIGGQNIFPAYLKMEKPLEVDFKGGIPGMPGADMNMVALIERAKKEGRDGVIMRNLLDSPKNSAASDQFIVFSPEQIRSAITLKRERQVSGRGMPVREVQASVQRALAGASLAHVPPVQVVQSYRGLPEAVRKQLEQEGATQTTGAVFLPGIHGDRVVLIAENNATEDEIHENVYHELVGHYGLTQVMDADGYNEVMDGLWRDMPDRVRESARRNGLDVKDAQQRRIAAEEVIAYAAGNIMTGKPVEGAVTGWWKKTLEAIRAFFQRLFGQKRMNDAAIARIVANSKKALEGQAAGVHKSIREGALRHQRPPLYYSQLFATVNDSKVPNVAPPGEYAKIIQSQVGKSIKPDEMEWSGVVPFLESLTYRGLLEAQGGPDLTGVSIPDGLRAPLDRLIALRTWMRDHVYSGVALEENVQEEKIQLGLTQARALGMKPVGEFPIIQWSDARAQIEDEIRKVLIDPVLAVAPKRIPKSMVLDFINSEQVVVSPAAPDGDEADASWINTSDNDPEVEPLDPDLVEEQVKDSVPDNEIREHAIQMVRDDPYLFLDDEDWESIDGNHDAVTDEMIENAIHNSMVLDRARKALEDGVRRTLEIEYGQDPYMTWQIQAGDWHVEIRGSSGTGFEGALLGPGVAGEYRVSEEQIGEVERALRQRYRETATRPESTKYGEYTVPGGTEYGERLFRWRNASASGMTFSHSHWDEENVLLHMRYDTRKGPKGEKILFLDEIQSDWHQSVRDRNDGPGIEQQLVDAGTDLRNEYRMRWLAPDLTSVDPNGRQTAQVIVQNWLADLPISPKQFRDLLLAHKKGSHSETPVYNYVYAWLADQGKLNPYELRGPPLLTSSNPEMKDPLELVPDELLSWKSFVTYLGRRDQVHERRFMDVPSDAAGDMDANAARGLARFMNVESGIGGGWTPNYIGALPPSMRTASNLLDHMDRIIPVYWDQGTRSSLGTPRPSSMNNLHETWPQLTPEMAGSEEGRKAFESIAPYQAAFMKVINESKPQPPSGQLDEHMAEHSRVMAGFEAATGKSFGEAHLLIERALETFGKTAKIPHIPANIERIVNRGTLELTERAEKLYSLHASADGARLAPTKVPPLAKTWPLAALKWALRHGAENGFDQIALAPGSVHGTRWGATTSYPRLTVYPLKEGKLTSQLFNPHDQIMVDPALAKNPDQPGVIQVRYFAKETEGGHVRLDLYTTEARLAGWTGREAAEKVLAQTPSGSIEGMKSISSTADGVSIWGPNADSSLKEQRDRVRDIHHGSMEIYNAVLPFMFNKFLNKYGAKIRPGSMIWSGHAHNVEQGLVAGEVVPGSMPLRSTVQVPVIDLNDKLKDTALNKGFPLFARRWTHGARALGNAVNNGNNQFTGPHASLTSRFWNYLVYHAQDKFIDLFRTQNAVAAWRGTVGIPDAVDAYMRQTLYHGRVEQQTEEFEKGYVEPLVAMIKKSGYDWSEVEDYLYARHAQEANARIAAINPGQPQFNSGMSDVDAQAALAAYAITPKFPELETIGRHIDTMTKFSRDMMVMEGLEDPSVIQAWEQTYKHYVPLKGWAGLDIESDMPKRGRGFDVGGKLTKMRTGRTSRAATILANVVAQAQSTIILAEKAKVGRALYDFVKATPAPDLWVVDQVEYLRYVDPNSGLVRAGVNPSFKLADNVLRVRQNGVDYHITFNPENEQMVRLAAAMKNLSADQIGPVFALLHGVNRVLSTLNTSLNPEFVVTNALRDLTTAMANLTEQQRAGLRRRVVADWRKAWWGIRQGTRGKAAAWAAEWTDFKRAGGKVGWIDHYATPQDLEKKLRKHLTKDNVLTYTVKGVKAVGDFIENENAAVENAIRLSTFVNLKKMGVSRDRAAEAAKNLTVNFNRKGALGTVMNSLYLFYNASIQGTARLWQLSKHPQGRIVMAGFVMAGIVQSLLMRAIGGDDDDKEKLYDKVPEHDKEKNIIIMIPEHLRRDTTSGEKPYIKLMLPYGFNTLYYTGAKIGDYFDYGFLGNVRRVEPGADAGRIAGSFLGAFSPIGDAEGGLSQFLLPTLADPFVQLADNKSWWGGKIMPEDFDEEAPSPDSQKFFQSVPAAYKDFAAWLNEKTGGTEVSPGYVDVSPETFQHWADFATGGAGRFAQGVINAPYKAIAHPEDLTTQEIPFWRKVIGGIGDRATQDAFFARINELKYVKRELDAVYKLGPTTEEGAKRMAYIANRYPVAVKMVRAAYPNFAESRGIEDLDKDRILRGVRGLAPGSISNEPRPRLGQRKAITTTLSDARKEIRRLEARTGLPAKERAEKIATQKQLIHDTLLEFNKQWSEVEDATYGERHQGKIIEKLGPLISGKKRREQVRVLRESGYSETASLLAALPPIPDRFAKEFFNTEAARETET